MINHEPSNMNNKSYLAQLDAVKMQVTKEIIYLYLSKYNMQS